MPRLSNEYQAVLRSLLGSRKLANVGTGSELLYIHLLLASDHWGRYWADPAEVLGGVFLLRMANGSISEAAVRAQLDELATAGLIRRYEAEGAYCLEIVNYFDPTPIPRRKPRFPLPPWVVSPESFTARNTHPVVPPPTQ